MTRREKILRSKNRVPNRSVVESRNDDDGDKNGSKMQRVAVSRKCGTKTRIINRYKCQKDICRTSGKCRIQCSWITFALSILLVHDRCEKNED